MTGEGADALDRDTRLSAAPEEVAAAHADAVQRDLHTMLPGIIKEYDATKQTVTVQPALKRTFYGQDAVDLPLCTDVPVVFPAGGPLVMTFPITAEDECLIFFAERSIDKWWDSGGTQLPAEYRMHDLSDGFALVGVSSKPRFLQKVNTSAFELRTRDGKLVMQMTGDGTTLSLGIDNTQPVPCGSDLVDVLVRLCQALQKLTVNAMGGPTSVPINLSDFVQLEQDVQKILSKTVVVQKEPNS